MVKVKYRDLSNWLKFAAIGGFISAVSYIIAFLIGFREGLAL